MSVGGACGCRSLSLAPQNLTLVHSVKVGPPHQDLLICSNRSKELSGQGEADTESSSLVSMESEVWPTLDQVKYLEDERREGRGGRERERERERWKVGRDPQHCVQQP